MVSIHSQSLCALNLVLIKFNLTEISLRKHPFLLRSRAKEKRMLSQAKLKLMTFILKVQMKFEIEHYFKNFLASVCLFPT